MKAKIAVVDSRIPDECYSRLRLSGFQVVTLPPSPRLGEPIASHPDMLIARVGGEWVCTADYCEIALGQISEIYDTTHMRFHFTDDVHEKKYPRDVIFNSLAMGDRIFARLDSLSPYLASLAKERGFKLINTKQGYPACTTYKLGEKAAITADEGMARALEAEGIKVYRIEPGGILLPPYEYGFIGGAGGCFGGEAFFIGDARQHPSWATISRACESEGLRPVMLGGGPLVDLGGILFAEGDIN